MAFIVLLFPFPQVKNIFFRSLGCRVEEWEEYTRKEAMVQQFRSMLLQEERF